MLVDPREFEEIPANPHGIAAGALLLPTSEPIVSGGGTSLDFVCEQGGDPDTIIFLFGLRPPSLLFGEAAAEALGALLPGLSEAVIEGVFLNRDGPGFRPTWSFGQLMRETDLGGWRVVPTPQMLERWAAEVERRMNLG